MAADSAADRLRLRLVLLSEAREIVAARPSAATSRRWHPQYPLPETLDALALLFAGYEASGEILTGESDWWIHQLVVDDQVVGDIGFHGPPADGSVEIGYAVVPAWRGRGLATRACALIVELAWRAGARAVLAEAEPSNGASRKVLLNNGFTAVDDRRFLINGPASR
jgi:RimJ/RimL family protein N-acetyltransferase